MLTLRCFGSVSIVTGDGELTLRSRKHSGLLLYLCAHPKTVHARADLARLLWNGGGARERHSLSQALYDIKSRVGPLLDANAISVRLRADLIEYDAREFERAVERGDHQAALDRYVGEFGPTLSNLGAETFDRWFEGERDRYRALAGIALRRALRESETRADWDGVCLSALRLIHMNDLDQKAHRALMRGLWLKGDGLSALEHYEELGKRWSLDSPGGLSPATIQLAARIREDEAGSSERANSAPELIGRSAQFAAMREAYDGIREGRSTAVIVTGEQGIGKTRLLSEFARYIAGRGAYPVRSVATGLGRDRPYCCVLDLMSAAGIALADDDPDLTTGRASTVSLRVKRGFELGVREVSARKPMALMIDDAEHMDAESAELLASCQARLARAPLLLVIAFDNATSKDSAVRSLEASLRRREATRVVELRALSTAHLARILKGAATNADESVVSRAITLAGGNPLYGIELVRCLTQVDGRGHGAVRHVPLESPTYLETNEAHRLSALIRDRVDALSPAERTVLSHLAVLGDAVDERLFLEIAPVEDPHSTLRELERKGLVDAVEDRWRLRHGAIRDFLTRDLGHTRRAAIHLAAATVLSRRKDADPLLLAEHFAHGGEREAAYGHAMRAAETAVAAAPATAAEAATLAATQAVTIHDRSRARLLQAHSELQTGRFARSGVILSQILATGALSAEDELDAKLALIQAYVGACQWGNAEVTLTRLRRQLREIIAPVPIHLRLKLAALEIAMSQETAANLSDSLAMLSVLLRTNELSTGERQRAWFDAWHALFKHSLLCQSLTSAETLFSLYSAQLACLDRSFVPAILCAKGVVATKKADFDDAITSFQRAIESLNGYSNTHLHATILNNFAVALLEQGQLNAARVLLEDSKAMDVALEAPMSDAVLPILNLGNCAFYQAQWSQGFEYYTQAWRHCDAASPPGLICDATASLGLIALRAGRLDQAREMEALVASLPKNRMYQDERFKLAWLAAFLVANSQRNEAAANLREASMLDASRDVVSHLKLQFLSCLAGGRQAEGGVSLAPRCETTRLLDRHGLGWFRRVAVRWWEEAEKGAWASTS